MTTTDSPLVHPAALSAAHSTAQPGSLVLLLSFDHKRFVIRLEPGRRTFTHLGAFIHDDLIGRTWGSSIETQTGYRALLLEPGLTDLMRQLKRGTQMIYPKDAAYIVHRLSLRAGSRVIEAGTGSAGLTTATCVGGRTDWHRLHTRSAARRLQSSARQPGADGFAAFCENGSNGH